MTTPAVARPLVAVLVAVGAACTGAATVERAETGRANAAATDQPASPSTTAAATDGSDGSSGRVDTSGRGRPTITDPDGLDEHDTLAEHDTPDEDDQEAGSVTSTSAPRASSTSRSTISTAAGRIEARFSDGELSVEVDSEPGWTADVQRRSARDVEVVWSSPGGTVRADVSASDRGITSSTRSVVTSG